MAGFHLPFRAYHFLLNRPVKGDADIFDDKKASLAGVYEDHSSRIRFLRFLENPKKRDFLRFFEVSCQKNVKKRRKRCPSFTFSTLKLLTNTFSVIV